LQKKNKRKKFIYISRTYTVMKEDVYFVFRVVQRRYELEKIIDEGCRLVNKQTDHNNWPILPLKTSRIHEWWFVSKLCSLEEYHNSLLSW